MNEQIKNSLGIAIILSLAVIALSGIWGVRAYSRSIQPSSFRSFTVSGEGKVIAVPDLANFSFSVLTEGGKNLSDLQKQNTEKINKIIDFLKQKGIDKKDIETQGYNLEPRYQYVSCRADSVCPPPEIVGYTIRQTVGVKVRKFDDAGSILSGTVDRGANSVSQLSFTIDDQTKLQDEAREQAVAKAKEKADGLAKAGGFKLGRLMTIEESPINPMPMYNYGYARKEMMGATESTANPAPVIEQGSQEVKVSVSLRYEIN
jgi:uncharacterized protein YggE